MLALVAGLGDLPKVVHAAAAASGPVYVAEFEGRVSNIPADVPRDTFGFETLGGLLDRLQGAGVTEICFAGAVTRAEVDPARIDTATAPLVARIKDAMAQSDDAALRAFLAMFEECGMTIRAAHDVAPDLLPPVGVLTQLAADDSAERDAARGAEVVAAMGTADVGQACVIQAGQAVAVEALPGTDWMLSSLPQLPDALKGGILFKAPKPGQDRRVDLPAIGSETVAGAAKAGLRGIVVEAGGVMILDRGAVIDAADQAGLFLWVREAR